MKTENQNFTGWATIVISITAITISIISICIALPNRPDLGFDYQGVIVGILSVLVTVLLAFVGGGFFFQNKVLDKKIEDVSNGGKEAIAENMFYGGYDKIMTSNVDFMQFLLGIKTAIAALNLCFSEDKAELLKNSITMRSHIYKDRIYLIVKELELIKYKSKAIDSCIKEIKSINPNSE